MHRYKQHISFGLSIALLVLVNINAMHYLLVDHESQDLAQHLSINAQKQLHNCDDFILTQLHFLDHKFQQEFINIAPFSFYKTSYVDVVYLSNYIANNFGRDPPQSHHT